jgi:hypothetical protein
MSLKMGIKNMFIHQDRLFLSSILRDYPFKVAAYATC